MSGHPSASWAVPCSPLWLGVTQVTLVLQATHVQLLQNPPAIHKALAPAAHSTGTEEMDTAALSAAPSPWALGSRVGPPS